jgi:hypothetical protein
MIESEFEKLKAEEAKAYAEYNTALDSMRKLGDVWLPLKQLIDRENMRRDIAKEMAGK